MGTCRGWYPLPYASQVSTYAAVASALQRLLFQKRPQKWTSFVVSQSGEIMMVRWRISNFQYQRNLELRLVTNWNPKLCINVLKAIYWITRKTEEESMSREYQIYYSVLQVKKVYHDYLGSVCSCLRDMFHPKFFVGYLMQTLTSKKKVLA